MFAPDLVEFVEVVMVSGLVAVCAIAIASTIAFTLAYVVFREHEHGVVTVASAAGSPAEGTSYTESRPVGRPYRESQPMVAG